MESQQQQSQGNKGVSGYVVLLLVVLAFGAGIFVGLHPQWIPIKTPGGGPDAGSLPTGAPVTTQPDDGHPMPATMPVTVQK